MRVLFVDHAEALGGAELSLLGLLTELRSSVQAVLASNSGEFLSRAGSLGVEVREVPMPRLRGNRGVLIDFWKGVRSLVRLASREHVDLIHANTARASLFASAAAAQLRLPLVWHARDIYREAWYRRMMMTMSSAVIATSRFVADHLPKSARLRIIPNGVNLDVYRPGRDGNDFRAALGIPPAVPFVGCVGRLRAWKGQQHFLRAAAIISSEEPGVHFGIIGGQIFRDVTDRYAEELRELARGLGISDRVHFLGHQGDMTAVYDCLDLLVHTSEDEPFGRVLIEAMAMQKPVVAFASGATPEIVRHGQSGLLVPFGSVTGIAECTLQLLGQPEEARRMGSAGRKIVEERFDIRMVSRKVRNLYERILGEGR